MMSAKPSFKKSHESAKAMRANLPKQCVSLCASLSRGGPRVKSGILIRDDPGLEYFSTLCKCNMGCMIVMRDL